MTPTRTTILGFLVATLASIALLPAIARASPAPEPRAYLRATTFAQASQLRGADGHVVTRRDVHQRFQITYRDAARPTIQGFVDAAHRFDLGLPSNPEHPLIAARQLQTTLHSAHVDLRPLPELHLRVGRQVLASTVSWARIDGITVHYRHSNTGFFVRAAAGSRPESARFAFNPWTFEAEGDPTIRAERDATPFVFEGAMGWSNVWASAGLAFREDRAIGRAIAYARSLRVDASIGAHDTAAAHIQVGYSDHVRLVDVAQIGGRVPIGDRMTLSINSGIHRPVFPLDSPFSVFAMTPHAEHRLSVSVRDDHRRSYQLRLLARAFTDDETQAPIGRNVEERFLGQALHIDGRALRDGARFGVTLETLASQHQTRSSSVVRFRRQLRTGPALHTSLTALHARDLRSAPDAVRAGGFLLLGATFLAGRWADISLTTTAGFDTRHRASISTFALVDIHLPGGPP